MLPRELEIIRNMELPKKLKHWDLGDKIKTVEELPVLARWLDRNDDHQPFKNVTALMLQHQLGNQVPQTEALIRLGLDPKMIHWIDIPYTSTPAVRDALVALGIPRENMITHDFKLLEDYAPYQRIRVQKFLKELSQDPPEHLLVLDDGAYLLEALSCQRHSLPRISIVEQTTRGLIKMEENAAMERCADDFPIINVAGSQPKLVLEPPFIGVAVCDALNRRFGEKIKPSKRDRCLILGYGAIGRQVALFAHHTLGFDMKQIYVSDVNQERMATAFAEGFSLLDRKERGVRFKMIIGCSGRASFRVGDHVLLEDGAFLASATSGTVELSREYFIELAESNPHDDIWIERGNLDESNLQSDIEFHFMDRNAIFVNGGFPVNFDGRVHCVPPHYIQPTPTMMCAAALQAVRSTEGGLNKLDPKFSNWLIDDFTAELGDEAHHLA